MMIDLDISKRLHGTERNFDLNLALEVQEGEMMAIYGPSGVGKTTLLRMIAGLEQPDEGHLRVAGETWFDRSQKVNLTARKRSAGLVFQDYALFPNMSVRNNIAFGQPRKRRSPAMVDALLDLTGLSALADRHPRQLSGGQAQRVALARAIAAQPRILLLDEALSALDLVMRQKMQTAVAKIHNEFDLTTLLVTHDLAEVFLLADRVVLLEHGHMAKLGSPHEVFSSSNAPANIRLIGKVLEGNLASSCFKVEVQGKILEISALKESQIQVGEQVWIEISPDNGVMKVVQMH